MGTLVDKGLKKILSHNMYAPTFFSYTTFTY